MQISGNQFFACAGFSHEKDSRIRTRDLIGLFQDAHECGAGVLSCPAQLITGGNR